MSVNTQQPSEVQAQAVAEIESGRCSCVVVQGGQIVWQGEGRGVAPIKRLYESEDGKKLLKGAFLADKLLGKAAAMLLVLGGVAAAYGLTVSEAAYEYLQVHGVPCGCGRLVPYVKNREGSGLCPLEQAVLMIDDPKAGYAAIVGTIARLMAENK